MSQTSQIPLAATFAELDSDSFRMAMRELAGGVAVVTVGKDGDITGFIATSVSSLCAHPPRRLRRQISHQDVVDPTSTEAADRQQVLRVHQSPDFKTVKNQSVKKGNRYERIQDNS